MVVRQYWIVVSVALTLLAGPAAAEGVYKWVDSQGHAHFGSTPPPGQKAERLSTSSTNSDATPAQSSRSWQEQLDLANQRHQQASDKEQASTRAEKENQQRCLAARNALDSMERGGARYHVNDQGEREYIDDSQRQAIREAASQRVAAYCR